MFFSSPNFAQFLRAASSAQAVNTEDRREWRLCVLTLADALGLRNKPDLLGGLDPSPVVIKAILLTVRK